jgi:hypothetical protein
MPIGVKLVIVIGLFLVAGLLIGWGSGTAAKGSKRGPRGRAAPSKAVRGPTFTPEIGRWGGDDDARRPTAVPDENPPKELPAERRAARKRRRALPEGD